MILVPGAEDGLNKYLAPIHHKYALAVNQRMRWKGHFWQERFYSTVMDENHLLQAVRYVELNPVRAKLCDKAHDWKWSSARAHVSGKDDDLVKVKPLLERVNDWPAYLSGCSDFDGELRKHTRTGRPIGEDNFLLQVEALTGRRLRKKKPGPRPVN
jgi:putative transposase